MKNFSYLRNIIDEEIKDVFDTTEECLKEGERVAKILKDRNFQLKFIRDVIQRKWDLMKFEKGWDEFFFYQDDDDFDENEIWANSRGRLRGDFFVEYKQSPNEPPIKFGIYLEGDVKGTVFKKYRSDEYEYSYEWNDVNVFFFPLVYEKNDSFPCDDTTVPLISDIDYDVKSAFVFILIEDYLDFDDIEIDEKIKDARNKLK